MVEFWYDYFLNDLENMEYRIEDLLLHSLTGVMMGITIKIKSFFTKSNPVYIDTGIAFFKAEKKSALSSAKTFAIDSVKIETLEPVLKLLNLLFLPIKYFCI